MVENLTIFEFETVFPSQIATDAQLTNQHDIEFLKYLQAGGSYPNQYNLMRKTKISRLRIQCTAQPGNYFYSPFSYNGNVLIFQVCYGNYFILQYTINIWSYNYSLRLIQLRANY